MISPTNARSWFVSDNRVVEGVLKTPLASALAHSGPIDGDLLVMTPVDPAFLLISLLRSIHSVRVFLDVFPLC